MDLTSLLLVDRGNCFNILTQHQNVKIDYRQYSMMIGSIDFDIVTDIFNSDEFIDIMGNYAEMHSTLNYAKVNNITFTNQKSYIQQMEDLICSMYEPLRKCLNTGHLKPKQLSCIIKLFLYEVSVYMKSEDFQWDKPKTYVPSVLCNTQLKEHIKSLLLRNTKNLSSELQNDFNNLELKTNIKIINGTPYTIYHITNTLDFLLIDLQKHLIGKTLVKECDCCKRLFIPPKRTSAKYCRLPHEDNDRTCDYIMHYNPNDEIKKYYNYIKRYQAKFRDYYANIKKYGYVFLSSEYDNWKEECDKQYAKAKYDKKLEPFKQWFKDTKFIAKRLDELHNIYIKVEKL